MATTPPPYIPQIRLYQDWLARERGTLYLTCRAELESYYNRFGFHKVEGAELPPYFRRLMRVAGLFARVTALLGEERRPIVMGREQGDGSP